MKVGEPVFGSEYLFVKEIPGGDGRKTDVFLVSKDDNLYVMRCQKMYQRVAGKNCICTHQKYIQFLDLLKDDEKEFFVKPVILDDQKLVFDYIEKRRNYIEISVWPFLGSDLFELTRTASLNQNELRQYHIHLLQILIIMKKYNFVHRDFKIENIVGNKIPYAIDWEFSDFAGCSASGGTDIYNSPEAAKNASYSHVDMDMWGFGTILFLTWSRSGMPEVSRGKFVEMIQNRRQSWKVFNFTEDQLEILRTIFTYAPERITPEELARVPYFDCSKVV